MTNIVQLMQEYSSFKTFSESLKVKAVTQELLEEWHRQIRAIDSPTIHQQRFIRCFFRKYHKRLGLRLNDEITDNRYQPAMVLCEDVLFEVIKAMYGTEIITGSTGELAVCIKQHYGLPQEVETIRQRLTGAGVINEELKDILEKMKKWMEVGKKSSQGSRDADNNVTL